jgi:hypothetical protein
VAWQRQLRDRHVEPPPAIPLNLATTRIEPVTAAFAAGIILRYEWLGTMTGTRKHFGIFFGPYCAGVTCVAMTGGAALPRLGHVTFDIKPQQLALLARGACVHWAPPGTNSRLVSWTTKLMRATGVKVMIAFADTDAGEIGTIYQACNWHYLGIGQSMAQYVAPNSRIWNNRTFTGWCEKRRIDLPEGRRILLAAGWKMEKANAKHRYATIVDKADKPLAARMEFLKRPYPKRGESIVSDAVGIHPNEAGATPSSPLGIMNA